MNINIIDQFIDKCFDEIEDAFVCKDLDRLDKFIKTAIYIKDDHPDIGVSSYVRICVNILRASSRAKDKLSNWVPLLNHISNLIDIDGHLDKKRILRGLI